MFYEIVVMIFYYDNKQHNLAHIHVRYQGTKAVFAIDNCEMIEGNFPKKQQNLYLLGWKYVKMNWLQIGN